MAVIIRGEGGWNLWKQMNLYVNALWLTIEVQDDMWSRDLITISSFTFHPPEYFQKDEMTPKIFKFWRNTCSKSTIRAWRVFTLVLLLLHLNSYLSSRAKKWVLCSIIVYYYYIVHYKYIIIAISIIKSNSFTTH